MLKFNKMQKWTITAFLIVPLLSSFISTYHIVGFFNLGNYNWMSIVLAIAFELGAIASALSITILDKISKFAVWSIFFILVLFQIIGNVYYTFDYVTLAEQNYPEYLNVAKSFLEYFHEFETPADMKMFLAILIGAPIPLLSLGFLKTLVDYVTNVKKENVEEIEASDDIEVEEDLQETEASELIDELELTDEDVKTFLNGIENPPEPNEELKDAVEDYKEEVKEEKSESSVLKEEPKKEKKTFKIVNSSGAVEDIDSTPPLKIGENKISYEDAVKQNEKMKKLLDNLYPSAKGRKFNDSELK